MNQATSVLIKSNHYVNLTQRKYRDRPSSLDFTNEIQELEVLTKDREKHHKSELKYSQRKENLSKLVDKLMNPDSEGGRVYSQQLNNINDRVKNIHRYYIQMHREKKKP